MATAFIRLKVALPDDEAVLLVLDGADPPAPGQPVRARQIVDAAAAQVMTDLARSPLVHRYHAEITQVR